MLLGNLKSPPINWKRLRFDFRLRSLEEAYRRSRQSSVSEKARVDFEMKQVDTGSEEQADWHDHLIQCYEDAENSLNLVRQSFALALYHLWEREAIRWLREIDPVKYAAIWYKHHKHNDVLRLNDIIVDEVAIKLLSEIANCIKHNKSDLFKSHPDLFGADVVYDLERGRMPDYAAELNLTDEHLINLFNDIRAMGPVGKHYTQSGL